VTSIILGIAAQQSLGNVFSGLVLLLSHCTASELDAGSVSCGWVCANFVGRKISLPVW
jgi:hypothetical protein